MPDKDTKDKKDQPAADSPPRRFRVRGGFNVRVYDMPITEFAAMSKDAQDALDAFKRYEPGRTVTMANLPPQTDIAGLLASGHLEELDGPGGDEEVSDGKE